VSTVEQDLTAQIRSLEEAGCSKVFSEKASGVQQDRKQLAKAINKLVAGDVLVVTRLDRLARSTLDLLRWLDAISKVGAGFKSLNDAWCDTTTPHGRLMLTVLGGLAEFERSLIIARTSEGRKRAIAAGRKMGRKPKLTPYQQAEALRRLNAGESQDDVAMTYGVHQTTISNLLLNAQAHFGA
jgi:DNA invertase Pin-like site-specific DNA recombinase